MLHYVAIKKAEILSFEKWTDLEGIMLSETSQAAYIVFNAMSAFLFLFCSI